MNFSLQEKRSFVSYLSIQVASDTSGCSKFIVQVPAASCNVRKELQALNQTVGFLHLYNGPC